MGTVHHHHYRYHYIYIIYQTKYTSQRHAANWIYFTNYYKTMVHIHIHIRYGSMVAGSWMTTLA